MYKRFFKYFIFLLPPEMAHDLGLSFIKVLGLLHRFRIINRPHWAHHERLKRESPFGTLDSPLGLAAGFDKNGEALWGWQALGFSFVEVGTVTPLPQIGNSRPRLFRYVRLFALVNKMGFNNDGVKAVSARIAEAKKQGLKIKVGGNIGKNFNTPLERSADDYQTCARLLKNVADYLVINVSSPNTPGLRDLQNENLLEQIVKAVRLEAPDLPLFVKIAPDNFEKYLTGILAVAQKYNVQGIVCGNTLANHASAHSLTADEIVRLPDGGLSGAPIFENNLKLCEAYSVNASHLYIIGVGGIDDHFKAVRYFQAHAKLIQVYTGLVFGGPRFVKTLLKALIETSINRHQSPPNRPADKIDG